MIRRSAHRMPDADRLLVVMSDIEMGPGGALDDFHSQELRMRGLSRQWVNSHFLISQDGNYRLRDIMLSFQTLPTICASILFLSPPEGEGKEKRQDRGAQPEDFHP